MYRSRLANIVKSKFSSWIFLATSFILLSACGGGGGGGDSTSPIELQGIFVDSPVANLKYRTKTHSGRTTSTGEFLYEEGEVITFSVGDIDFPTALASALITPLDLVNTTDVYHPEAVNIARLLQTLDMDGNAENGIEIGDGAHSAAQGVVTHFYSYQEFDMSVSSVVANSGAVKTQLVSGLEAIEHLRETLGYTEPVTDPTALISSIDFLDSALKTCVDATASYNDWTLVSEFIYLQCTDTGINNTSGIEYLSSLKTLDLSSNNIESINLNQLTSLRELSLVNNQIVDVNLSRLTALKMLSLGKNQLHSLDLSQLPELLVLALFSNQITTIDLSIQTGLKEVYLFDNNISAIDLSQQAGLVKAYFHDNPLLEETQQYLTSLDIETLYFTVNKAPSAVAGADQTIIIGDSVTLNASNSVDDDGSVISYLWTENGVQLSTNVSFSKSDFTLGSHTLTLTVIDNNGLFGSDSVVVVVNSIGGSPENQAPEVSAGTDQSIIVGESVTLAGIGSDSDGSIDSYVWTENGVELSTQASFTKTDFTIGTHTLTLVVADDDGLTASDSMVVTVASQSTSNDLLTFKAIDVRPESTIFEVNASKAIATYGYDWGYTNDVSFFLEKGTKMPYSSGYSLYPFSNASSEVDNIDFNISSGTSLLSQLAVTGAQKFYIKLLPGTYTVKFQPRNENFLLEPVFYTVTVSGRVQKLQMLHKLPESSRISGMSKDGYFVIESQLYSPDFEYITDVVNFNSSYGNVFNNGYVATINPYTFDLYLYDSSSQLNKIVNLKNQLDNLVFSNDGHYSDEEDSNIRTGLKVIYYDGDIVRFLANVVRDGIPAEPAYLSMDKNGEITVIHDAFKLSRNLTLPEVDCYYSSTSKYSAISSQGDIYEVVYSEKKLRITNSLGGSTEKSIESLYGGYPDGETGNGLLVGTFTNGDAALHVDMSNNLSKLLRVDINGAIRSSITYTHHLLRDPPAFVDQGGYIYSNGLRFSEPLTRELGHIYVNLFDVLGTRYTAKPCALAVDGSTISFFNTKNLGGEYDEVYEPGGYLTKHRFVDGLVPPGPSMGAKYNSFEYPTNIGLKAYVTEDIKAVSWQYENKKSQQETFDIEIDGGFSNTQKVTLNYFHKDGAISSSSVPAYGFPSSVSPAPPVIDNGGSNCGDSYSDQGYDPNDIQVESQCKMAWIYCSSGAAGVTGRKAVCAILSRYEELGGSKKSQCSYCDGY